MASMHITTTHFSSEPPARWVKVLGEDEPAEVLDMPNFGRLPGVVIVFRTTGEVRQYLRSKVEWVEPPV